MINPWLPDCKECGDAFKQQPLVHDTFRIPRDFKINGKTIQSHAYQPVATSAEKKGRR